MAPKPTENQCVWRSRLSASDGLRRLQNRPNMAQEISKRAPRELQDRPRAPQERSDRALRRPF
eukprot:3745028-Pyramimonas_sp.AAC.1